jgi:hypothetical protein
MMDRGEFMRNAQRFGLALVIGILLFAGCKTTPVAQRDRAVDRLIETINSGNVEEITELSQTPFVLDRELLMLESDVQTMWERLYGAGFSLEGAEVESVNPADSESYRTFSPSMEMRVYFRKYLADDGTVVRVASDQGTFVLLVGGRQFFTPELYGLKGPIQ